ncbi:hypothetical protein ABIB73_001440 [Bradyrhizobium sp. F1.4.3]
MQAFDDRFANVRSPAATISKEEYGNVSEFGEVGAVDDRTAASLGDHEACARQDRKMSRKSVRGDFQLACKVASRKAIGLVPDQRLEGLQTSRLGQSGEFEDGVFDFHISRFMEILKWRQSGIREPCRGRQVMFRTF